MIKDKSIEAVYIATDAPSHARLAIMALEHGKHVVSAVPAVFGFEAEDEAEKLFNAVKKSGMKYMLNETSTFHAALYEKTDAVSGRSAWKDHLFRRRVLSRWRRRARKL